MEASEELGGEPGGEAETYNPWSIVHLVFEHLSDAGLHPTFGDGGDPGGPAGDLLRALAIEPSSEGNKAVARGVRSQLAELRAAFDEPSQGDTPAPSGLQSPRLEEQPAPQQGEA